MRATIEQIRVFVDGSGAPAVITCGPCDWHCECVAGEVRIRAIRDHARVPRAQREASRRISETLYRRQLGDEFLRRNRVLYG